MYSTGEAAERIGVCKNTLLRWISEGLIPDVERDWRGWRIWSDGDVAKVKAFKGLYHSQPVPRRRRRQSPPRARYARAAAQSMARYGRAWTRRERAAS